MKSLRILFFALAVGVAQLSVPTVAILAVSACTSTVKLEPGGVYSDPVLATADQSILDASRALTAFVGWHAANSAYLQKWPEVGNLATKVSAQKDGWIRDAYAARDAYAIASSAYKKGLAAAPDPQRAKLTAALSLLNSLTTQIASYQAAHPHA